MRKEKTDLEKEIRKCVEGVLPIISADFYSRHNTLLAITLILSLIPLLTYILI